MSGAIREAVWRLAIVRAETPVPWVRAGWSPVPVAGLRRLAVLLVLARPLGIMPSAHALA